MARQVEPKIHSAGGRMYNAVGQGASTGFRGGLLGGLTGFATAILGGAAIGALAISGIGAVGAIALGAVSTSTTIGGALVATIPTAAAIGGAIGGTVGTVFSVVPTAVGAVFGGAAGFMRGSHNAREQASMEEYKAREQMAYQQTANAIVAQQFMAAEPAMAAVNDNPYHQAASQIDASTIAHQQTVEAPSVEQARG